MMYTIPHVLPVLHVLLMQPFTFLFLIAASPDGNYHEDYFKSQTDIIIVRYTSQKYLERGAGIDPVNPLCFVYCLHSSCLEVSR